MCLEVVSSVYLCMFYLKEAWLLTENKLQHGKQDCTPQVPLNTEGLVQTCCFSIFCLVPKTLLEQGNQPKSRKYTTWMGQWRILFSFLCFFPRFLRLLTVPLGIWQLSSSCVYSNPLQTWTFQKVRSIRVHYLMTCTWITTLFFKGKIALWWPAVLPFISIVGISWDTASMWT